MSRRFENLAEDRRFDGFRKALEEKTEAELRLNDARYRLQDEIRQNMVDLEASGLIQVTINPQLVRHIRGEAREAQEEARKKRV
jgi:hypothetical protein